jgi:hypothetical protein
MKFRWLEPDQYFDWLSTGDVEYNVFGSREWCACYGDKLLIAACGSDRTEYAWVMYRGGRFGVRSAITLPLAPCIGWARTKDSTSSIIATSNDMLSFIRSGSFDFIQLDFPPAWSLEPDRRALLSMSDRYTYRLALPAKGLSVLSLFSSKTRNMVSKGQRDGLSAHRSAFSNDISERIIHFFITKEIKSGRPFISRLFKAMFESGRLFLIEVKRGDVLEWTGVFLTDGALCYYLSGVIESDIASNASATFGLYSAMQECEERKCTTFDFEGSMIPSIEQFVKGFGGEKTYYTRVQYKSPKWKVIELLSGRRY